MVKNISKLEKTGLYCTIIASVFLIMWAIFSVISGLLSEDVIDLIVGTLFIFIGSVSGYYAIRFYRKVVYMEKLLDSSFEDAIYQRLEPLAEVISETRVEMVDFSRDLKVMLNKVENLEEDFELVRKASSSVLPKNDSDNFIIKSQFLLVITLSFFIFVVEFPSNLTPYIMPIFFLMWWFLITAEYSLFSNENAWIFGSIPVILIPMSALFIAAMISVFAMTGILFIILTLYTGLYYIWASYTVNGTLPFNIHKDIREALIEMSKKDEDKD